jgi:hypothetical protein
MLDQYNVLSHSSIQNTDPADSKTEIFVRIGSGAVGEAECSRNEIRSCFFLKRVNAAAGAVIHRVIDASPDTASRWIKICNNTIRMHGTLDSDLQAHIELADTVLYSQVSENIIVGSTADNPFFVFVDAADIGVLPGGASGANNISNNTLIAEAGAVSPDIVYAGTDCINDATNLIVVP